MLLRKVIILYYKLRKVSISLSSSTLPSLEKKKPIQVKYQNFKVKASLREWRYPNCI